jgi:hypothetical protein
MMMRKKVATAKRIAVGFALYLSAVAIGLGSVWWVLKKSPWMITTLQVGAWESYLMAGSQDADMYTRAAVAVNALLALGRDETMYFVATRDEDGRLLRSACSYRVEGLPPKARWWSITAYADDMYLFDAPNKHYSLNGSTAQLDALGRFSLVTGPAEARNTFWLPTPGQRGLVLTLRLYNPEPELQASPASLIPPSIQRLGDCA